MPGSSSPAPDRRSRCWRRRDRGRRRSCRGPGRQGRSRGRGRGGGGGVGRAAGWGERGGGVAGGGEGAVDRPVARAPGLLRPPEPLLRGGFGRAEGSARLG